MNQNFKNYLKENRKAHLEELITFLKIPSISALSEHKKDIIKAADWLKEQMKEIGLENVQIMETDGNPVVYGDWLHAENKPTALIYGHYDVQPVDPIDLWESPPFEPVIKDEKIYARGASDDKGQVFMHLKALEALFQTNGNLPLNVKFILEAEEEIGSPHLPKFISEHKDLLEADFLVISDTGMIDKGRPAICYGLRGLTGLEIRIKGAKTDLHSGQYGGGVPNAAHAMVELLSTFHDRDGNILVEGFYDKVRSLTAEEKMEIDKLNTNEDKIPEELGVPELIGETGYNYTERTTVRPTLEINGVGSGFQGEGVKTVIPSEATAKITCRLVPDQDPAEIYGLLVKHIRKNEPKGVTVSIIPFDQGAPFIAPLDHPALQAANDAYKMVYGVPAAFVRTGGSIPIVADFQNTLNLPVVMMGFALPGENFHAPNEHFHLENFDMGMLTICNYWLDVANRL